MEVFDVLYKIITGLGTLGILSAVWKIANRVGAVEQWMRTTDKEVGSQGSLLQQLTSKVSEIAGWMKGKFERS